MKNRKFWSLLFLTVLTAGSLYAVTPKMQEIRQALKNVKPDSAEDYALGEKLLPELQALAAKKQLKFPRTMLMMETLTAAGLMWKAPTYYTDRQLFGARDVWESGPEMYKKAGHQITFDMLKASGVDILSAFQYNFSAMRYFTNAGRLKLDPGTLKIAMTLSPRWTKGSLTAGRVKFASESPYNFMIDGKPLFVCYQEPCLTLKELKDFMKELDGLCGKPVFYLHSLGLQGDCGEPYSYYIKPGHRVPASVMIKWFDRITEILDLCGGFEYYPHMEIADSRLYTEYYDKVLLPILLAPFAQERFNGKKVFALQIMTGYSNYRGKQRLSHDGTKTLRDYLELCKKFKVDIMKGFEWDEYQEDSHFQPTVNKPMAHQRILKYYMDQFKNLPPTPNEGDDLSLPNLIVTHRKQHVAGNDFEVELLQVPDTTESTPYTLTLELLDADGKVVFKAEKLQFDSARLLDRTLRIPSKDIAAAGILVPRLTIDYQGETKVIQEGLPTALVRPTTVCDSTWLSTPLRNIAFPEFAEVKFGTPAAEGLSEYLAIPVSAKVEFNEPLTSLEVMQERLSIFAHDPANEFHQNDPDKINVRMSIYYFNNYPERINIAGKFDLKNAPSATVYQIAMDKKYGSYTQQTNPSVKYHELPIAGNNTFDYSASYWRKEWIMTLSKSELDSAVFNITGSRNSGANKGKDFLWDMPLKNLKDSGLQVMVFPDGLQVALEIGHAYDSMPLPLDSGTAEFDTVINTGYPQGLFFVQAVTRSGKVWRSKPFTIFPDAGNSKQTISVFDDAKGAYKIEVPSSRIPKISYRFDPAYGGTILTTPAGREFYGNAGGADRVATGFEGFHNSLFSLPRIFINTRSARGISQATPQWEKMPNGKWCLNFSGNGEYITFPVSVLPQRAGFTLTMDVYPEANYPQQYFTQYGVSPSGFTLRTNKEGKFEIVFDRKLAKSWECESRTAFTTKLSPKIGAWNIIRFKYDLNKVSLTVNGKTESFPCVGIGQWLAVSGFGGSHDATNRSFKGKLKRFEVVHSVR
ncbi:MAG: LamG domain-containing protein [Lentisphaerae bacterium]|nr:LamG domain-containing protein [Lentisphaerota bacterium]